MDLGKVIQQLYEERARLDEAIQSLERLQQSLPKRGRPPLAVEGFKKPRRAVRKKSAEAVPESQV